VGFAESFFTLFLLTHPHFSACAQVINCKSLVGRNGKKEGGEGGREGGRRREPISSVVKLTKANCFSCVILRF